ncbi:hypothetical protein B0H13DRAFT_257274 [Mycena leptocephala]|nr:hypothetical protein B0H13DRAFT_257274 [Mycena leptocephala]
MIQANSSLESLPLSTHHGSRCAFPGGKCRRTATPCHDLKSGISPRRDRSTISGRRHSFGGGFGPTSRAGGRDFASRSIDLVRFEDWLETQPAGVAAHGRTAIAQLAFHGGALSFPEVPKQPGVDDAIHRRERVLIRFVPFTRLQAVGESGDASRAHRPWTQGHSVILLIKGGVATPLPACCLCAAGPTYDNPQELLGLRVPVSKTPSWGRVCNPCRGPQGLRLRVD